ncbi:MAG: thiamine phosphate synthase [Burkholderiaceae bacterium]|jgi:thiamine-phosphate pyrophosphorylase|nr:thiamine phosphate synthase [Burkholderiaceae bacterium]
MKKALRGLYIVTPDWDDTDKLCDVTEKAIKGGARIVQYRHKTAGEAQRHEQASALQALCRRHAVPFIINDHVDLCIALSADGIHVGGTDESVAAVRARVGKDTIVGASCYGEMELARCAREEGASYVAFGGFYPSRIKKYPVTTPFSILSSAKKEMPDMPTCAIGGITLENGTPLVKEGADMISVISAVYFQEDPEKAASAFSDWYRNS